MKVSALPSRIPLPSAIVLILLLASLSAAIPAFGAETAGTLLKTSEEILAENPGARLRLVGAYSEIPGFPQAGKHVKILDVEGTELVCVSGIKLSANEKMRCWRDSDAPDPLRKVISEEEAKKKAAAPEKELPAE
jgi:hypothetical protein